MERLRLGIANIPFELEVPEAAREIVLRAAGGFATDDAPTLSLTARPASFPDDSPHQPRLTVDPARIAIHQLELFSVEYDRHHSTGTILYAEPYPHLIATGLRSLWATLLALNGGLLLHASAVRTGPSQAIAFLGRSGAGKSTVCLMFGNENVLNDEMIAVTNISKEPLVHSTPFYGSLGGPRYQAVLQLQACCGLLHGTPTELLPLHRTDALRLCLQCCALPQGDCATEDVAFQTAHRLAGKVPWHTLRFARDRPEEVRAACA